MGLIPDDCFRECDCVGRAVEYGCDATDGCVEGVVVRVAAVGVKIVARGKIPVLICHSETLLSRRSVVIVIAFRPATRSRRQAIGRANEAGDVGVENRLLIAVPVAAGCTH